MAARVSHIVHRQANKRTYLHYANAMGPNLSRCAGTAVAGGIMLTLLGVINEDIQDTISGAFIKRI